MFFNSFRVVFNTNRRIVIKAYTRTRYGLQRTAKERKNPAINKKIDFQFRIKTA